MGGFPKPEPPGAYCTCGHRFDVHGQKHPATGCDEPGCDCPMFELDYAVLEDGSIQRVRESPGEG